MTRFSIDIVSDTVCPWCYVGYRKLNRAITEFSASNPGHTFDITWKPYYLNPDSPKVGIDKTEFYYSKFGAERVVPMFQRLSAIGEAEGIHFKFGGKTGNTRDSHRLIQMAKEKGLQTRMVEELFAAYFENEKDITSFETLLDAAKKAGLEEDEVKGWLGSDAGGDIVDKEVHVAQRHGISGVPNFTINGRYEIGGAQDPREFIAVFKGLADASTPATTGMTC
ncbi:uncharacterized protein H6S33_011317 [Morchella sextelata]|uniref:uncharacterized protein n=1 Tax=Morchella sextelata TaxID=1174677 RepID=UPI001D03B0CF|nr:uncharacterized protein H6S33_011317 [Morchella sextelata]KAH0610890.1 hypothetical protein H6S33_011317 [Morchella sextelata]